MNKKEFFQVFLSRFQFFLRVTCFGTLSGSLPGVRTILQVIAFLQGSCKILAKNAFSFNQGSGQRSYLESQLHCPSLIWEMTRRNEELEARHSAPAANMENNPPNPALLPPIFYSRVVSWWPWVDGHENLNCWMFNMKRTEIWIKYRKCRFNSSCRLIIFHPLSNYCAIVYPRSFSPELPEYGVD